MRPLTKAQRLKLIDKLEKDLYKICHRLYDLSVDQRRITPMHPNILVRVLPKEHRTAGGIWLAENEQNKPVYEGIVLAVWKSWTEEQVKKIDGEWKAVTITHSCHINVGDRVAFPHYEGVRMKDYLDDKYYRLVRESSNQAKNPYQQILGVITYDGDVIIQSQIRKLTAQLGSISTSGENMSRGAQVHEVSR